MDFKKNLAALPEAQGTFLRLVNKQGEVEAVIENAPGTAGSFRVYAFLAGKYGEINVEAANEGLAIYAEHTDDARLNPGKHPNIDRLFEIVSSCSALTLQVE